MSAKYDYVIDEVSRPLRVVKDYTPVLTTMVFSNLGAKEKDAFFTLLDEYFQSRPEIFSAATTKDGATAEANTNPFRKDITSAQVNAAAATVGRAGDAAAKFVSSGFKSMQNTVQGVKSSAGQQNGDSEAHDTQSGGSLQDRIAALQGAGKRHDTGGSTGSSNAADRGSVSNLTSVRKFGDVDMSSGKNFYSSIRKSNSPNTTHSPSAVDNIPSAFPKNHNSSRFGPPTTTAAVLSAAPPRQPEPEPEPEEPGDWAEALYDFESSESGDLELKEGQRVLVIEQTSDDWWTGKMDGKQGLFPASYVKLI